MEKIKVINRHYFGVGFNVLCLATAGAMTVEALKRLCELSRKIKRDKTIKETMELVEAMDKIIDFFKEAEEDKKGEDESQ